jgi:uncharacterized protein DUF664
MTGPELKADLHRYLQTAREALLWKLDGLSEYQIRRPMVPTGTNLLGLVKHLAGVEAGYFGVTFDRPFPESLPWMDDDAEPNADLWATAEESRDQIVELYTRVRAHSDATIEALELDAIGRVPWWPEGRKAATLHRILTHMVAEAQRHAGHADIIRELVDGAVGLRDDNSNLPGGDRAWWQNHRDRLENAAVQAEQNQAEQNRTEQNQAEQNQAEQNQAEQNQAEQNRTEQNQAEQNQAEQNQAEQNQAEQNRKDPAR